MICEVTLSHKNMFVIQIMIGWHVKKHNLPLEIRK
jgi:hypothetical protein